MTTITGFTPGEWRVVKVGSRDVLVNTHGGRITYLDDDLTVQQKNLIASAPAMHAELQALRAERDRLREVIADSERDAADEDDDSPYCECGNEPMEDELASNKCDACGRPLE